MNGDWQTWAAAGIVFVTLAIFAWRVFGNRKRGNKPGCGSNCGCGGKTTRP